MALPAFTPFDILTAAELNAIVSAVNHYNQGDVVVIVSDTQPSPDPSGSVILWVEPLG